MGAKVMTINSDQNEQLSLTHLLSILHFPPYSIKRLMVEGGARIIQSFLKSGLTDLLIITIAPILVGPNAISATSDDKKSIKEREREVDIKIPKLENVKYEQLGKDIIIVANISN
jgi:2,5-diamino-6-(ribosylamino)-4(3H)-pyrimidinone 5'-phosphate reductase